MNDFLQAQTFDGELWVSASDAMALRSRLAEAEALLRENCGDTPMPLGWFDRVRIFLAPDSATHREDEV